MALGKELFFFFEKSLPRAYPQILDKEILFFLKKSLPRAMGRPSAKDPFLLRALVIALGKEAEI